MATMLKLQDLKEAIDRLTPDERRELRAYLENGEAKSPADHELSPEERIRRLDEAARAIREGFTDAEWEEVEQAINEEYIEPWDESEWTD